MDVDVKKPWDRLATETAEEYEFFRSYLELRTFRAVAEKHGKGDAWALKASLQHTTAQKQKWSQRRDAYDRWIAKQRDDALAVMVKTEITIIGRQRLQLLRHLYRVIQKVGKRIDERLNQKDKDDHYIIPLVDVTSYAILIEKINAMWSKMEKDNPATLTSGKPYEQQILTAKQDMMNRVAAARVAEKPLSRVQSPPATAGTETLQ